MSKLIDLQQLGYLVRAKRGEKDLRTVAAEIGTISPATLSRIERGSMPDLETFVLLCSWLDVSPAQLLQGTPEHKNGHDSYRKIIQGEIGRIERKIEELKTLACA